MIRPNMTAEMEMPKPTPPKCVDWTQGLPEASPWDKTIAEVKTMTKALASPARKRMTARTMKSLDMPIASRSRAVETSPVRATLRSMPSAQP
jgi:hypothetical protein